MTHLLKARVSTAGAPSDLFLFTSFTISHLVDSFVNQRRSGSLLNFTKFVMIPDSWTISRNLLKFRQKIRKYKTQTPSSRSFVVRFTQGSVFITASNLNMECFLWQQKLLWMKNLDFETLMFEQIVMPGKSMSDMGELVDSTFWVLVKNLFTNLL